MKEEQKHQTAKEYFDKSYGKIHIERTVGMNDLTSLYALMEEYAEQRVREEKVKMLTVIMDRLNSQSFLLNSLGQKDAHTGIEIARAELEEELSKLKPTDKE